MNRNRPDPRRYVREHGNGVTDAGIERALKLLPAMRAIGDPMNGSQVLPGDLPDVKSCLEAYKSDGKLSVAGIAGMMWSDMGIYDSTDMDAVGRLSAQDLPGGGTKYRFAFQAVPLAMEPSYDLMHEGWWHLLSDKCGNRNMEEFVDQDAAGTYLSGSRDIPAGDGKEGMAAKLAEAWKGLDAAAPCGLEGAEGSVRMMQFCALQAAAYLDGYDFMPDEAHAKAIGAFAASGFKDEDMAEFKGLLAESLHAHGQPQKEAALRKPSALDRLRGMLDDGDQDEGPDGPEL